MKFSKLMLALSLLVAPATCIKAGTFGFLGDNVDKILSLNFLHKHYDKALFGSAVLSAYFLLNGLEQASKKNTIETDSTIKARRRGFVKAALGAMGTLAFLYEVKNKSLNGLLARTVFQS